MRLLIVRFLILIAAFYSIFQSSYAFENLPILLDTQAIWTFTPSGFSEKIPVSVKTDLGSALPMKYPCCKGSYEMSYHLSSDEKAYFSSQKNSSFGILLDPVAQLRSIELNGNLIKVGKRNPSEMILIPLTAQDLQSDDLKVRVGIDGPRLFHSGMWLGYEIHLDEISSLVKRKQSIETYQIVVPRAMCVLFLCLVFVLVWLKFEMRIDDKRTIDAFILNLVSWIGFYFFLTGSARSIDEFWGSFFHLPVRAVAGITTFRLVALLAGMKNKRINLYTIILLFPLTIHMLLLLTEFRLVGMLVLSLYYFVMLFPIFIFFRKIEKSFFDIYFFLSATLAAFGYLNDGTRLCASVFSVYYPMPYLNRYTTAPFLFGVLIYLVHSLIDLNRKNTIRNFMEEATAQFNHDIRSPLQALQIANSALVSIDPEIKELLVFSTQRIKELSGSLGSLQEQMVPIPTDVEAMLGDLRKLILEKKKFVNKKIEFIFEDIQPKNLFVLANRGQLVRVFSNILNNSIESITDVGKIEIKVFEKKRYLEISILDTGTGISEDILKNLGKKGRTFGKADGVGLGLYSTKKNVEFWKGTFSIRSKIGVGSCVTIGLQFESN